MNREAVYDALFTLLTKSATFVTSSRRVKLWTDLNPSDFPCLFMAVRDNDYAHLSRQLPQSVTLNVDIFLYTNSGLDPAVVPAAELNDLVDAVDAALRPDCVTLVQTLGGIVDHCWIEGKVTIDPGDMDGIGLAVIPVKILIV